MEVAVRDDEALVDEHERIVGRGVQLDRDGRLDVVEEVAARAVHLRRAAKRVGVLHLVAPAVRLDDRRPFEQAVDVRGRVDLPAQRPCLVDRRVEARPRALERLERERAGEVGDAGEPSRAHEREGGHRGHELRAVDQRQTLLRRQRDRLEPRGGERVGAAVERPGEPRPTLADERQGQVRERREVAARADRAAGGDARQHAPVQALDQQLDRLDARAGVALCERVRAQQHRRPDDVGRIGLADPTRMAAEQPELELLDLIVGNRLGDEAAEAGVDAVGVLRRPIDQRTGRLHARTSLVGERDRCAVDGDLPDVVDPEVVPRQRVTRDHAVESRRRVSIRGSGCSPRETPKGPAQGGPACSFVAASGAWVLRYRGDAAGSRRP